MDDFRVYNNIRRVGVEWRAGEFRFGLPSATVMMAILFAGSMLALAAYFLWWPLAAAVLLITGAVEMFVVALVVRLNHMMGSISLRETTQLKLIRDYVKSPFHKNYPSPDFTGESTIIKNF